MSDLAGPWPTRSAGLAGDWAAAARRFFRVPPATERVRFWHVCPAVDMAAYHFSWLWVLVPLVLAGPDFPRDYIPLYVAVLTFSFVHRHYTLGYAYLDREIFTRHRKRFIWAPLILGAGLLATPYVRRASIPEGALSLGELIWPAGDLRLKILVTSVVFVAGVWNVWHTLAQKYGILRIYTAKARAESESSVPGWVDRLLVMGWLPLIVSYVAPALSETILHEFRVARKFLRPLVDGLAVAQPVAVPIATAIAGASVVIFFGYEWRAHRLRNRPRLSMAIGLCGLWAGFVLLDPIKVYLAFAFSHGLEYMVFVWAFQRRRYAEIRSPQPLMARILERPWLAYPLYTGALAALYICLHDWDGFRISRATNWRVGDVKIGKWVFYWGVFQSLLHFYYDGFLWKTRQPGMRRSL